MCLLAFRLNSHPRYKLILMANRDEEYGRPTAPAAFWKDAPGVLAGRDLEQMGTWLGINRQGKVAALTNYRDFSLPVKGARSRGDIVTSYLRSDTGSDEFLQRLHEERQQYTGFNVLAGSVDELSYYSNIEQDVKQLKKGTYGLSNALLDTHWPKVEAVKEALDDYADNTDEIDTDILFGIMQRTERFPSDRLPDTGAGEELESLLSSIFIASEDYGTRCTTVLLVDRANEVYFEERTYRNGEYAGANTFTFPIEKPVARS